MEIPSITALRGAGKRTCERLGRLGITTLEDLLFHLPHRYEDRTQLTPIRELKPGGPALVQGKILMTETRRGRRSMLLSRLHDGTGTLELLFFHRIRPFPSGMWLRAYGQVREGRHAFVMVHPDCLPIEGPHAPLEKRLTPVYPTTEGLPQSTLRRFTREALAWMPALPDFLPECAPPLHRTLEDLHRPPPGTLPEFVETRRRRLAVEELTAHVLALRELRRQRETHRAPPIQYLSAEKRGLRNEQEAQNTHSSALSPQSYLWGPKLQALLDGLPFRLTRAQARAIRILLKDLEKDRPMQRLLQGDVGSGKTVVAAAAATACLEAGFQVAVMAPTEILAEQHLASFERWLAPLGFPVMLLSGRIKGRKRQTSLARLCGKEPLVAAGTHALFQDGVDFGRLGLIIVDEQQRFGVKERQALRRKGMKNGLYPHQLIMTATPIPRTLAQLLYADLDHVVLDELPPGRKPVRTAVISDERREEVIRRIFTACRQGRQAYWICPLIEDSETLQCQAAEATARRLRGELQGLSVGLLHGRMDKDAKAKVMTQFKTGDIQLLVATTVIEVGVDVPDATLMIIEDAQRFGLAQLHQLRGRVGRGQEESVCLLMYHPPLPDIARKRLSILRETHDGFAIAERDLELRGPGDPLGVRQAGLPDLRIPHPKQGEGLIPQARKWAQHLERHHPERIPGLIRRWLPHA